MTSYVLFLGSNDSVPRGFLQGNLQPRGLCRPSGKPGPQQLLSFVDISFLFGFRGSGQIPQGQPRLHSWFCAKQEAPSQPARSLQGWRSISGGDLGTWEGGHPSAPALLSVMASLLARNPLSGEVPPRSPRSSLSPLIFVRVTAGRWPDRSGHSQWPVLSSSS